MIKPLQPITRQVGDTWRISPSLLLHLLDANYLRIELAGDFDQWFLLPARLVTIFVHSCVYLQRQAESHQPTPWAGQGAVSGGEIRVDIPEVLCLIYEPETAQVRVTNAGREVLRFEAWELAALSGGVAAAFGKADGE
jgi:hypothetical protein